MKNHSSFRNTENDAHDKTVREITNYGFVLSTICGTSVGYKKGGFMLSQPLHH